MLPASAAHAGRLDEFDGPGGPWSAYAFAKVWAANDVIPIKEYDKDLSIGYDPKNGRNVFLMRNRAEVGATRDGWEIALEYRQEITLNASRDTLDAYRAYQGTDRPTSARQYVFDGNFRSWKASGVHLARTFKLFKGQDNSPLIKVTGALYNTPYRRDKDITGSASYLSNDSYALNGTYSQSDNRYEYPFQQALSQTGNGASVSVAAQWPVTDRLKLNLQVNDLWSRMRWKNLPGSTQTVQSNGATRDTSGIINVAPFLSGRNSQETKSDSIGTTATLGAAYRLDERWSVGASAQRIDAITIPTLSASYNSRWGATTLQYDTRFKSVGVGYSAGPFEVAVLTDKWNLSEARTFGVQIGLKLVF